MKSNPIFLFHFLQKFIEHLFDHVQKDLSENCLEVSNGNVPFVCQMNGRIIRMKKSIVK